MANTLNDFYNHLKNQPLKPLYLIASDVSLLQQEARDALRKTAIHRGFTERQSEFVEAGFDWHQLFDNLNNLSLFSDKVTIELHNPNAKFEENALKILQNYLKNPSPDRILIVLTDKLTSAQQKARWYKTLERKGYTLNIRAITKKELPGWINSRAKQRQLKLDHSSVQLLVELTEGNLLATDQALQKLKLLFPNDTIDRDKMLQAISDSTRFSVFDLGNAMLAGQTQQALRCLQGLKNNGCEPTLVLWALCRELRELIGLVELSQQGTPLQQLLQRQWQSRRSLLQQALRRLPLAKLNALLLQAEQVDLAIKGAVKQDTWNRLEKLVLTGCLNDP